VSRITPATLIAMLALARPGRADDWPQWMGPNRDSVWHEKGILQQFPKDGPKVLWRVPVAAGYAGPAVAGGKVFLTDYVKSEGNDVTTNPLARNELKGKERVQCLDAKTGKELWKHEYDRPYSLSYPAGPRCTPTVHEGKVYTLGAMGNLLCLDTEKGTVVWSKDFVKDYGVKVPLYGFCGHPLVDGKKLICTVGGDGTTAVAFDKDTGKELWRSLSSKELGYSPPTLIEAGGKRQLLVWHGESLNSIDPETGKPYWSVPLSPWMAVVVMAPRKDGDYLFAGTVYGTAIGLKLDATRPAVTEVWRGPKTMKEKGLYPMNMTPFAEGGILYGTDQPGQFRAVEIATGKQLWESWLPVTGKDESAPVYCGTVFVVKNGGRFFLCTDQGELLIAKLSREGYEEVSRWKMLEPTGSAFGRKVVWSHPAFADKCIFAKNDKELVCVSLAE
jgi:outer membrane protein assembly factor BamB